MMSLAIWGMPGMNSFAKSLSANLNIKLNTRVISLGKENKWVLEDAEGNIHEGFDWVISTAPSPQTVALFPKLSLLKGYWKH